MAHGYVDKLVHQLVWPPWKQTISVQTPPFFESTSLQSPLNAVALLVNKAIFFKLIFCHGQDPQDRPGLSVILLACCCCCYLVVFLGYRAVTRGKNKLTHGKYILDPKYINIYFFYRLWTPYKLTSMWADQRCPRPPKPLKVCFWAL